MDDAKLNHPPNLITVVEDAPRMSRLWAAIIDRFIVPMPLTILWIVSGMAEALTNGIALSILLIWLLIVTYQTYLLARDGQTLGKKAARIKIVDYKTNEKKGFGHVVLIRSWLNFLFSVVPAYALIDVLFIFASDRRCIHDLIAGTKVIKKGSSRSI